MISPLVRRRRLAAELIRLREEHRYSAERLAETIGVARQRISRIENGHIPPDLDEIDRILTLFQVGQAHWKRVMAIARDAQARGWWEKYAEEIGPRQALYANLEAGASSITEYQLTFLPGLLQTPMYTEARAHADRATRTPRFDPARALEARATRQRVLEQRNGPTYEVIIDELAIRRFAAPPEVVRTQLDHLAHLGHHRQRITIRVLPIAARIANHAVPRSAFSTYRYPDPDDPVVVTVDTVTSDLILTNPDEVNQYTALYQQLRQVALTPADSLDFLAAVAEELHRETEGDQHDPYVHQLA